MSASAKSTCALCGRQVNHKGGHLLPEREGGGWIHPRCEWRLQARVAVGQTWANEVRNSHQERMC